MRPCSPWRLLPLVLFCALCLAALQGCQPKSGQEDLYGDSTYDFGSQDEAGRSAPAQGEANAARSEAGTASATATGVPGAPLAAKAPGAIIIPARSTVEWTAAGNCLDPDRPAPRRGDVFRLVPVSGLIDPQLLPLYEAFLRLSVSDAEARRYQQQIVWALRTVDKRNSYASSLGARQKALLDRSLPGGAALFDEVRVSKVGEEGVGDFLAALLPRISFFGFSIDLADLMNPDTAPAVADSQLEQLINMPVEGPENDAAQAKGNLAPGIETRISGAGPLVMRVSISNTSNEDYVFMPTSHAAEPRRHAQRLSLAPPDEVTVSRL